MLILVNDVIKNYSYCSFPVNAQMYFDFIQNIVLIYILHEQRLCNMFEA